jgi:hypothetical protein
MEIFTETLNTLYTGATADEENYAKNMAEMFNYNYFRDTDQKEIFKFKIIPHAQITLSLSLYISFFWY